MSKYDVVIVGAGPGGSLAAKTAAEKGLKTIFLERGVKPGAKNSSGCGLGGKFWRDFPDWFEDVFELPSCRMIGGVEIIVLDDNDEYVAKICTPATMADRKKVFIHNGKEVGLVGAELYRSDLDPFLADMACKAGAELRTSLLADDVLMKNGRVCGVKLETGEKLEADVVIAADGAFSTMAIKAGMRGRWKKEDISLVPQLDFSCNETKLDDFSGNNNLLWFGPYGGFYQGNFRSGFHLGNGQWLDRWKTRPIDYYKRAVSAPLFKKMCRIIDAKPREYQAHLLPWMKHPPKTYTGGMMLVGDAGGFPCPMEAEGVWHACYSGQIAAEVAAEAISKGDPSEAFLSEYERRWEASKLGREFDFGTEFVNLWGGSVFAEEKMSLLVQLVGEVQWFNFFPLCMDWSDDHMTCINEHLGHILDTLDAMGRLGGDAGSAALGASLAGLGRGITPENKARFAALLAPPKSQ